MTSLRDEARWIIGEISEAKRLAKAGGKPQLANSAIEAGKIEEYDQDGTLVQIMGEQHDGTHAPVTVNGPVPPETVAPAITAGIGSVEGRWSGKFAGGAFSPLDFSHVALHASRAEVFTPSNETQLATITGELGDVAVVLLDSGEWTFGLVAVSKAGKWSGLSETVTIEVPDYPDPVDIQDELIRFDEVTGGLLTEAGNLGDRLDQAEEDLTAHEGRLGTAEQRVTDAFVQIGTADGKATAAAGAAATAQSKADTAAQAAADAAGIAAGKGKVLVQSTAPGAADRNAVTLWIDTTGGVNTPKRWTTGTTWAAVTDKAATDAAAAAAQAAQAAANAQSAAGSAQTTANNALTMAGTKGKVFYSESAPSGTGTAAGDLWRRIDTSKNVIGEWYWSGSAWTSSQITTSAIANLDVGKLSVGTGVIADLVAQHIAGATAAFQTVDVKNLFVTTGTLTEAVINKLWADVVMSRKITAQMVAIGSFENLVPDDDFETGEGDIWYLPAGGTGSAFSTETTFGNSKRSMMLPLKTGSPTTAALYASYLKPNYRIPVAPGETYYITTWAYLDADSVGNLTSVQQRVYHYAGRGTSIINGLAGASISAPPVRTWFQIGGLFTIPAGSYFLTPRATAYYPNGTANLPAGGRWFFSAPKMVRANGGELVLDGSMKARHIDTEDLAANTGFIADLTARIVKSDMFVGKEFTGGTFTGNVFQSHAAPDIGFKLDGSGFRVYGPEGGEPVTEIRADGGTVYAVTDPATGDTLAALDSEGGVTGKALNIEGEATLAGVPIMGGTNLEGFSTDYGSGLLDFFPRAMVVRGYRDTRNFSATNKEGEILELSYDNLPSRGYRIEISPMSVYIRPGVTGVLCVYQTRDGSRPTMDSPLIHRIVVRNSNTSDIIMPIGGSFYDLGSAGRVRYLFTFRGESGQMLFGNFSPGSVFRVWVEDIGFAPPETGINRTASRDLTAAAPPAPPEKETENYVQTWTPSGYRSFEGSSRYTYADGKNRMYQGDGPYAGMLRSVAVFGNGSRGESIATALSGATITSMRVTITFPHWYYGTGGTAELMLHGATSLPTTLPSMTQAAWKAKIPRGGTVTMAIPSSYWNGFKTGTYRGIGLGANNAGLTYYGYAKGSSVKLEIKYTK